MRRAARVLAAGILLLFILFVAGQALLSRRLYRELPGPPRPPLEPVLTLGSLSAAACVGCHGTFHAEWQQSAHARAFTDRLYQEEFAREGRAYPCTYCHTPLMEQRERIITGILLFWPRLVAFSRENPHYTQGLEQEGVNCVACHQRGRALAGPHPIENEHVPHAVKYDPGFAKNDLCLPCHSLDVRFGAHLRRPIQDTFGEWRAYREAGGDKDCVDCHMPEVAPRPLVVQSPPSPSRKSRSHALRGPLDLSFLRSGLVLRDARIDIDAGRPGAEARLSLWNGTGHRLPTAEPNRRVVVALEALSAAGAVLRGAEVVLERVVHGLQEPSDADTTLLPRETRSLHLSLPGPLPAGTHALRLQVRYVRWDSTDPSARRAGLTPAQLVLVPYEIRQEIGRDVQSLHD